MKYFNDCVQPTVNACRVGDQNPNSSVVTEIMTLLANRSYGFLIKNRSRHSVKMYEVDGMTQSAIIKKVQEIVSNAR